jgi:hypothetical protein
MMKTIKSFAQIFLSGLVTAIAINYLIVGFVDIVVNINQVLLWLDKSGVNIYINQILKGIFGR